MTVSVRYDIGPAVHQGAGLARYAEQLAVQLVGDPLAGVDLRLFYNAHSGHSVPASLHAAPADCIGMGQYAWRLSVLASQVVPVSYTHLTLPTKA